MAKGGNQKQYTEDWFLSRGYTKNKDGSFQPPPFRNPLTSKLLIPKPENITKVINLEISSNGNIIPKQPVVDTPDFTLNKPVESFLTIDGLVAGLNGDKGLMRSHWTTIKKQKDLYCMIIKDHLKEGRLRKHSGQVSIEYVGFKSVLMDWDNFAASFKHIGDSLVKMEVIKDDKPNIVKHFIPVQIKSKRVDQKVIIIIKDI